MKDFEKKQKREKKLADIHHTLLPTIDRPKKKKKKLNFPIGNTTYIHDIYRIFAFFACVLAH